MTDLRQAEKRSEERFRDQMLGFALPARDARGRTVRLDRVLNEILAAHDYPPALRNLLAEALVLTALMGGLVKDEGSQMTLQAQTQAGPVSLLACDYRDGELRGYIDFDAEAMAQLGSNPSLTALFGEGYLAITFDPAKGRRYQGIVPLEGSSLAESCESYFKQSEQVPTLIRVGVHSESGHTIAGGLLVQHLADGEEGRERLHVRLDHPEWEHVAILAGSLSHAELVDADISLEALIWRLFHEEDQVRIDLGVDLAKGCRCSIEHYREVLQRFPEADLAEMRDDTGNIVVDCAFCSREFAVRL